MLRVDPADKMKLITPLFRNTRGFYIGVAILTPLVGLGIYMYVRQLIFGLGETGMNRPTYWGIYMVNFIFFIGISHAGTLISAILRVTGAEWRRPITRVAEAITAFALIVGTLQIVFDMGRPDRLWFAILHGRIQSPIMWDIISVTTYFLGSLTYLYLPLIPDAAIIRDNCPPGTPAWQRKFYTVLALGWRGTAGQWIRLEKAIAFMAVFIIPVAISVHTIISWILATTVQPGWHSSIFGPYFVVGAIFSGIGALFIAMTAIRRALGLEKYIGEKQYRNLGLLFLTMNGVWAYFTFAENLGVAAGQQVEEFPVLASKLWGTYAGGFWLMIISMILAFWILLVPDIVPKFSASRKFFRPQVGLAFSAGALLALVFLLGPGIYPDLPLWGESIAIQTAGSINRTLAWVIFFILLTLSSIAVSPYLKNHKVTATVIASFFVLLGMWLERWNIIIPTMTHPRLVPYASYTPTITEISLTIASFALFILMFMIFFRLFPPVSIWEFAEGRVIQEAQSKIRIPRPEPSEKQKRKPGFTKRHGG